MKFLQYLQALLAAWVIYFVVISMIVLFALFIGAPIIILITKGQLLFPPPLELIIKAAKFTVFAAIFSGTVVWIAECVFGDHDNFDDRDAA